jgi:hypothetical protein
MLRSPVDFLFLAFWIGLGFLLIVSNTASVNQSICLMALLFFIILRGNTNLVVKIRECEERIMALERREAGSGHGERTE